MTNTSTQGTHTRLTGRTGVTLPPRKIAEPADLARHLSLAPNMPDDADLATEATPGISAEKRQLLMAAGCAGFMGATAFYLISDGGRNFVDNARAIAEAVSNGM